MYVQPVHAPQSKGFSLWDKRLFPLRMALSPSETARLPLCKQALFPSEKCRFPSENAAFPSVDVGANF
jgi:hypothetical protein